MDSRLVLAANLAWGAATDYVITNSGQRILDIYEVDIMTQLTTIIFANVSFTVSPDQFVSLVAYNNYIDGIGQFGLQALLDVSSGYSTTVVRWVNLCASTSLPIAAFGTLLTSVNYKQLSYDLSYPTNISTPYAEVTSGIYQSKFHAIWALSSNLSNVIYDFGTVTLSPSGGAFTGYCLGDLFSHTALGLIVKDQNPGTTSTSSNSNTTEGTFPDIFSAAAKPFSWFHLFF